MKIRKLTEAICKITLKNNENLVDSFTGFFIADNQVLTVGHPIKNNKFDKIHIQNNVCDFEGTVLETYYDFDQRLDYSIISLNGDADVKTVLELGTEPTLINVKCVLYGYPSNLEDPRYENVILTGPVNKTGNFYQSNIKDSSYSEFAGLSGCPYFSLEHSNVVAMQSHKHNRDRRPFAVSIESIINHSKVLSKIYIVENKKFKRVENLSHLFLNNEMMDNKYRHLRNHISHRWTLLITNKETGEIRKELESKWSNRLISNLNKSIKDLFADPCAFNNNKICLSEIKQMFLDSEHQIIDAVKQGAYKDETVRVFIDPLQISYLKDDYWIDFRNKHISHSIAIDIVESHNDVKIKNNDNFGVVFEIGNMNHKFDELADKIITIIFDVFIDIYIYYKYNFFQNLFNDPNLNLSFSKLKVEFAKFYKYKPYCKAISYDSLDYISISSLDQPADRKNFNISLFKSRIQSFVTFIIKREFNNGFVHLEQLRSTTDQKYRSKKEETLRVFLGKAKRHHPSRIKIESIYNILSIIHLLKIKGLEKCMAQ